MNTHFPPANMQTLLTLHTFQETRRVCMCLSVCVFMCVYVCVCVCVYVCVYVCLHVCCYYPTKSSHWTAAYSLHAPPSLVNLMTDACTPLLVQVSEVRTNEYH